MNPWTPEEDDALRRLWAEGSREEILEALPGRTWHGIQQRGCRMRMRDRSLAQPAWRKRRSARERHRAILDYVADYLLSTGYGPSPTQVARALALPTQTVRNSVDELVKGGLVVRLGVPRHRALGLAPKMRAWYEERRQAEAA